MSRTDAFALQHSDLNAFLYASVGTELNGMVLTVLSVLARRGEDPWDAAGRMARLPTAAAADLLVENIVQMPMSPQALADAGATASRLILLLHAQTRTPRQNAGWSVGGSVIPRWASWAILYFCIALGISMNMILAPGHTSVATPTEQVVPQAR